MSCIGTGYLVALLCLIPAALYGLMWAIEVARGFRHADAVRALRLLASVQAVVRARRREGEPGPQRGHYQALGFCEIELLLRIDDPDAGEE